MRLAIFGAGYVGLVTGACFAELGNEVAVCDVDEAKITGLQGGKIPFYEPGLEEIVRRTAAAGRLWFTTDAAKAAEGAEIFFVAVGTPSLPDGSPELKYVQSVLKTIAGYISQNAIVVLKSTVPPGTSSKMQESLNAELAKLATAVAGVPEVSVVSNPEFLKEGDAVRDFMKPDRIVIGAAEGWAKEKLAELYAPFIKNGHPVIFMAPASAEMSKYAANAMLASRISFMNQMAAMCEMFDADIEDVRRSIAADLRIGPHFLYPGVGYGGSCFPKDVQALIGMARSQGIDAELLGAIESVNERQKMRFVSRAEEALGGLAGKKVAIWGLSFKPNTDDMRQAPSVAVIESLLAGGSSVTVYDPVAMAVARKVLGDRVGYALDMYECLRGADALFLITEWAEFKEPDFDKVAGIMRSKNIFDGRNIYDPARLREKGFKYIGVGRL